MQGRAIRAIHDRMLAAYGPQGWWPAETAFEVVVGAVLTQNTAWTNVEYALANLRAANALSLDVITGMAPAELGELIRPSGYYNIKARRLQAVCGFVYEQGGMDALADWPTEELREALLGVHGVGPETADDIVLYAFHRPVFVIDAYTRRIFSRLGVIDGQESYESLRAGFERALGPDTARFQEYHGLIVQHAKEACRVNPACGECCLRARCPTGKAS